MKLNKEELGQVFTPKAVVKLAMSLILNKNPQLVLEPSCGNGAFYNELIKKYPYAIGVEIDKNVVNNKNIIIDDYFHTNYHPDVIIANPPYVEFKNIKNKPKSNLLFHKPNLYAYFIEKMSHDLMQNGELIVIVPTNIFTNSSNSKLNAYLYENFSILNVIDLKMDTFLDANIATSIIHFIKTKNHPLKLNYSFINGQILFITPLKNIPKTIVKVGGASGFNNSLKDGNTPFVVSTKKVLIKNNTFIIKCYFLLFN